MQAGMSAASPFGHLRKEESYFIRNVPYSPILNPIEQVFSIVKNVYKRKLLIALQVGAVDDPRHLKKNAIADIKPEQVRKILERGLERWNRPKTYTGF